MSSVYNVLMMGKSGAGKSSIVGVFDKAVDTVSYTSGFRVHSLSTYPLVLLDGPGQVIFE